jgi:hypothetical protein
MNTTAVCFDKDITETNAVTTKCLSSSVPVAMKVVPVALMTVNNTDRLMFLVWGLYFCYNIQ